ncbi:peptidoglycan-associated lipoprotein Pal [Sneathiella sp. P13V-1]|uniref:peptidoglycan-associated lipoprotein Pal n=1 Tax=Sneathiella sp. P13V-1 TaxID=2697366 RepID=UPI00187B1AD8|nr:peptidoglycan-associated lipoprotein Pal [Sneathiella sp. P13V-1]MBE7637967.1 peptidoglycan-associated lipoprotein Pal [Sneathiella sp. P13V-1]
MRLNLGLKFLSMIAALTLVAACETAPQDSGDSSGGGASTSASTSGSGSSATSGGTATSVQPGSQEDLVLNVGDRVFFGFDKYNLTAEARSTAQRQAAWLKANPTVTVTIEGHADERGTREYNLALGERRATAVKNYLVTLGVSSSRVATISYGKERPVALGHNEEAWSQNRRGVMTVN